MVDCDSVRYAFASAGSGEFVSSHGVTLFIMVVATGILPEQVITAPKVHEMRESDPKMPAVFSAASHSFWRAHPSVKPGQ